MPRTKKTIRLLPGTMFGRLRVIHDEGNPVLCRCECGTEKTIPRWNLTSGIVRSCGCLRSQLLKEKWSRHALKTTIPKGSLFGRLRVLVSDRQQVQCQCACGAVKWVSKHALLNKRTTSCGCYSKEVSAGNLRETATKHGGYGTRIWNCWSSMLDRCENPKVVGYEQYGGQGITVCPEWHGIEGFRRFRDYLGEAPSASHTLDRIDDGQGYEPGNVCWATPKEQARHRNSNFIITVSGKSQCLSAWAEEKGIQGGTIRARLIAGWEPEKAVSDSTKPHRKHVRRKEGKEKRAWYQMNRRCREKSRSPYDQISVCKEWQSRGRGNGDEGFKAFLAHIGPAPSTRHSVDRIDNARGYEPNNVRWATPNEQARNQKGNLNITAFGKVQCLSAWATESGLSSTLIRSRLLKGWLPERALMNQKAS